MGCRFSYLLRLLGGSDVEAYGVRATSVVSMFLPDCLFYLGIGARLGFAVGGSWQCGFGVVRIIATEFYLIIAVVFAGRKISGCHSSGSVL